MYKRQISHRVIEWRPHAPAHAARPRPKHYKKSELVLIVSRDGAPVKSRELVFGNAWVGVVGTVMATYDFHRPKDAAGNYADCVHVLAKALGWDCAPAIVKELGGLLSLLAHENPRLPTTFDHVDLSYGICTVDEVEQTLNEMADEAREYRELEEAERTHFEAQMEKFSPGAPKKRERRGAAVAAEQALAAAGMDAVNVDGSVQKGFLLQWGRRDRQVERVCNKDVVREQKEAGGAEAWHRKQEERGDGAWEPEKKRQARSRSRTPTPTPTSQPANARAEAANNFLAFINSR